MLATAAEVVVVEELGSADAPKALVSTRREPRRMATAEPYECVALPDPKSLGMAPDQGVSSAKLVMTYELRSRTILNCAAQIPRKPINRRRGVPVPKLTKMQRTLAA